MDTTGNQAALIEVPRDDGSIDRAIDALDTKITAWVQAVADAQRTIGESAQRAAAKSADALRAAADAQAARTQAPPVDKTASVKAVKAELPPEAQSTAQSQTGEKKAGGLRLGHLTAKKPPTETLRKGIRVYEEEVPETVPVRNDDNVDPDEALLDTLDPKLAKQIRIKRRLCNNTKSIRQLLDETKR